MEAGKFWDMGRVVEVGKAVTQIKVGHGLSSIQYWL
jgi:hypothetical protein